MATEKLSPAEFEAFWKGHNFDDNCPARPSRIQPARPGYGTRTVVRRIPNELLAWEKRESTRAVTSLRDFLDSLTQTEPVDVIKEGVFKLAEWEKGTILRFRADRASRDSGIETELRFFIIGQAKTTVGGFVDTLIVLPSETVPFMASLVGLDPSAAFGLQGAVIGKVHHMRFAGQDSQNDRLLRLNSVEIWQRGTAVREQVKAAGFKPKKVR